MDHGKGLCGYDKLQPLTIGSGDNDGFGDI